MTTGNSVLLFIRRGYKLYDYNFFIPTCRRVIRERLVMWSMYNYPVNNRLDF